jgi:hypothetical protein
MKPIKLNPPQSRIMRAVALGRTITLAFGRGVGKSWFIRRLCYLLIAQREHQERVTEGGTVRGVRIVFLMPTFKQFRDVHSRSMQNELDGEFAWLGGKVDKTTFTVTFPGGSTIQVFPASEHGGQRARGIRCDVVMMDEADDIDPNVYDAVIAPWFTEPWSLKIKVASGTPKRGRHGLLYRLFDAGRKGARVRAGRTEGLSEQEIGAYADFYSVHATYREAVGNVDQAEAEKARVTMPAATFEREYECNFDAGEGIVYPFEEGFHVQAPPDGMRFNDYIVGVDHGWADPGVFLLIGIYGHGADAGAWVLDEVYQTERPNSWWNDKAKVIIAGGCRQFYADPSRPDRIADLSALGASVVPADNAIHPGLARVANLLVKRPIEDGGKVTHTARLYVHPRCVNTIREFNLYRRKRRPDGTFDEDPEDKNNHAMDALRYALIMRFGRLEHGKHIAPGR